MIPMGHRKIRQAVAKTLAHLAKRSHEKGDEELTDLLVGPYPTKVQQDN